MAVMPKFQTIINPRGQVEAISNFCPSPSDTNNPTIMIHRNEMANQSAM